MLTRKKKTPRTSPETVKANKESENWSKTIKLGFITFSFLISKFRLVPNYFIDVSLRP